MSQSQPTFTEPASQGSHVKVIVTQDGPNGTKTTRVKQMVTSSSPPMNSTTNQGQMQNSTGQPERRRTSHTLLYVPEEDRIQGVEQCCCPLNCGTTMTFCQERKISLDIDEKRRTSNTYTGVAPCIAFRPILPRRASQPTLVMEGQTGSGKDSQPHSTTPSTGTPIGVTDKQKMLTKRVSWLSMKSLQEVERYRRRASGGSPRGGSPSRTMSQIGSIPYLLEDREFDSDTPPLDTLSWSNAGNEYDNVTLMYAKHEKIPMKDFGSEIRATMDIDHLLNKAVLLLDLQETSLEEIFAKIIHEMDIQEPEFTSEQVRSVLFTQDAANQFHILSRTVQSICTTGTVGGTFDYDQTWICALCMLNSVQHRHVAIARLSHPTNLGRTMQDLRFIIIVIAPSRAKGTKTALETSRTFATLFADMEIRQRLVMAQNVEQFRSTLLSAAKELAVDQNQWRERKTSIHLSQAKEQIFGPNAWYPFRGLREEFSRRIKHYPSDFIDGIQGPKTIQKLLSTIVFLYFACLLPAIAFGVLNDDNTKGAINVRKVIMAQAVGGIFFSLFGGQPMIILLTTVPLAIYIKVIHKISEELGYDFLAMYACVGICCQMFLILYSATELCSLMKLATRSAEEMFSLFIAIAFTVESIRAISNNFKMYYNECDHIALVLQTATQALDHYKNGSDPVSIIGNISQALSIGGKQVLLEGTPHLQCRRDTSILYMLLMFGTLWLGLFLYNFRKTPYLTRSRREWLADYALPASVLIMSFLGSYAFSDIEKDRFKMRLEFPTVQIADIFNLPLVAYFVCLLLGFSLSFLFFIDQNITSAIVNNSQNKLKKGSSQSLDLFVVAILNVFLSMVGLPWMHGALPHSPLHLRALADVEERVSQGHVHEVIMNVRETRLASLIAHVLILLSTFYLLPYPLQLIPTSVLHGLFLYMALTSLSGNEMFERLLLLITEQSAYPPTHYIRKVPQRKVHLFTGCQLLQLIILCGFGFSPYPFIEMIFPVVCFLFLPIRHTLIPRIIDYNVAFYSEFAVLKAAQWICEIIAKHPSIVCEGITGQFKDEAMYVFSRLTRHKPSVACGYLLPQCADSTDPEGAAWIVTLPPKPKDNPRKSRPIRYSSRSNAKDLRVLQLTDIHVDFQYLPGSEAQCSMPVCCRDNSSKPAQKAGYWGTAADCDIPPWTVEHMLQHISQSHQIDAIILTGDYINHVDWQYSEDEHLVALRKLQNLIVKYFPSTPTYWSLGNHEGVPVNSFAPHFVEERFWPTWLYNQLKNMSSPWVEGNVTNRQISKMGSYSTMMAPGLKLISLNTGFCETTNFFLYLKQSDPDGTMSWLVRELYASEKSGDAVHIMAHIPPGDGECLEGWARNYYRVVQRFANTITAQYFGHDHNDFFIVFYENMDDVNSRPVSVGYAAPSVTTYSNLNPAYRIYTLDASNRYVPSNFEVYTTDLYKYPTANDNPEWNQLYSAKEEYGLPDLSPNSWNKLINQIYTETSTRNTFTK